MKALGFAMALLTLPALAWGQRAALSPAECQALRDRIGEHARISLAARRALGIPTPAPPSAAQDPASRAEAVRARLAQIREERERLENEKVGTIVKLDFTRVARIQEQLESLDQERRTLEAELAGLEQGGRLVRTGPQRVAPSTGPDLARMPCQHLPALEEKAVRARRKELGGAEGQTGLVPLFPLRGQTDRDIGAELAGQLGSGPEARQRLGLLDQDGDTQVDGFADSPASGVYRPYRHRSDGSLAVGLFLTTSPASDAPSGEDSRRLEEALLRQTRRRLAELLPLRPVGPARVLGETGEFARLRGLVDSGRFDQVVQGESLAARSVEFQNYRGEAVRLLEAIAGDGRTVYLRSSSVLVRSSGEELREETVTRFRPVSYWKTDVEVDVSRETKPAGGGAAQPRSVSPTIRFTLER